LLFRVIECFNSKKGGDKQFYESEDLLKFMILTFRDEKIKRKAESYFDYDETGVIEKVLSKVLTSSWLYDNVITKGFFEGNSEYLMILKFLCKNYPEPMTFYLSSALKKEDLGKISQFQQYSDYFNFLILNPEFQMIRFEAIKYYGFQMTEKYYLENNNNNEDLKNEANLIKVMRIDSILKGARIYDSKSGDVSNNTIIAKEIFGREFYTTHFFIFAPSGL